MKSLDTLLAEAVGKMKPATRRRFSNETRGEAYSQESLINVAETMVREDGEDVRESHHGPIRRNNGGSRQPSESEARESAMQEADAVLFEGMAKCRSTAAGIEKLVEVGGRYVKRTEGGARLSEAEAADAEFCRLIGMSESDALKVAKSNFIRGD